MWGRYVAALQKKNEIHVDIRHHLDHMLSSPPVSLAGRWLWRPGRVGDQHVGVRRDDGHLLGRLPLERPQRPQGFGPDGAQRQGAKVRTDVRADQGAEGGQGHLQAHLQPRQRHDRHTGDGAAHAHCHHRGPPPLDRPQGARRVEGPRKTTIIVAVAVAPHFSVAILPPPPHCPSRSAPCSTSRSTWTSPTRLSSPGRSSATWRSAAGPWSRYNPFRPTPHCHFLINRLLTATSLSTGWTLEQVQPFSINPSPPRHTALATPQTLSNPVQLCPNPINPRKSVRTLLTPATLSGPYQPPQVQASIEQRKPDFAAYVAPQVRLI